MVNKCSRSIKTGGILCAVLSAKNNLNKIARPAISSTLYPEITKSNPQKVVYIAPK